MFDIGASELLLTVIVAVVVIGPKDMPVALRTAGRWIGRMRRMSNHFRTGLDAMIRDAELEDMERKWRDQNEAVMKAHPDMPRNARAAGTRRRRGGCAAPGRPGFGTLQPKSARRRTAAPAAAGVMPARWS